MEKLFFPNGLKKHNKKNMCKVVQPNKVLGSSMLTKITHMCAMKIFIVLCTMFQVVNQNRAKNKKCIYNLLMFSIFLQ